MGLEWREAGTMFQAHSRKGTGGSTGWTRSRNSVCLEKKGFLISQLMKRQVVELIMPQEDKQNNPTGYGSLGRLHGGGKTYAMGRASMEH